MVSAILAPVSLATCSNLTITLLSLAGSLPSQSFWGANRILAPLAPPLQSVLLYVLALSQAVLINSELLSPVVSINFFALLTSKSFLPSATGSCQIKSSLGASGPI